jgi:iron(III) transport system substrate-binding protein
MSTIRRSHRGVAAAAVGLLAAACLAACGSSDAKTTVSSGDPAFDAVIKKANDEGQVVVYTSTPESQEDRMIAAFNKSYPDIKVTVVRGAGELPERIAAEEKSGAKGADVFTFSDPSWFDNNSDSVVPLDGPNSGTWPAKYWEVDHKAALTSLAPFGMILWNKDIFPNGFKTWQDLLDPSVKGKLGTRSDATAAYVGFLQFTEKELGDDYLKSLGGQDPKFYPSAVPMAQAVASGEIGVTNLSVPAIVKDLQDKGAPVEAVVPKPGYAIAFASGALKNASHPNAARVYLDFVLSEKGQAAYNGDGLGASARDGIEAAISLDGLTVFDSKAITPNVLSDWDKKIKDYLG